MKHFKKDSTIKVYGIDKLITLDNEISQQEAATKAPTLSRIRKILKEKILAADATPEHIIVASDHSLGVQAAQKAGVAMVLGIHRKGNSRKELYDSGADYVVDSLSEIEIVEGLRNAFYFSQELPAAFQFVNTEAFSFMHKNPVFFFDYDGTLAPIVRNPEKAHLKDSVRELLQQLSEYYQVAIVSGRDLRDVRGFVQLDHLVYAGSHGFRISGPGGISWTHSEAEKTFPLLDKIEKQLVRKFSGQEGVTIERKYSALAIHYRNAPKNSYKKINRIVDELIGHIPDLRKGRGKKIIEIKPAFDWNKGKAVEWILRKMGLSDQEKYLPVYLGDDITDEDAFKALSDHGISILVGDHGQISAADMQVRDSRQVEDLLHVLVHEALREKHRSLTFS